MARCCFRAERYRLPRENIEKIWRRLMPLPFKLVSADSHVVEPPDLWLKRLDRKYQDRAPRLVCTKKTDFYLTPEIAGEARQGVGLVATKGKYSGAQSREFT